MRNLDITRYFINISALAAHMFAILSLSIDDAGIIGFSIYSFVIGLFCGDCNTLNFYRRNNIESKNRAFLSERLIIGVICLLIVFLAGIRTSTIYIFFGFLVGLFFPQGRISQEQIFTKIILYGGILKILLSGSVIIFNLNIIANELLLILSTASIYIAILIYNLNKGMIVIKFNNFNFYDFKSLCYSALISVPIQIYTSVGALIYFSYNASPNLGLFYQTEKLLRGLGATVVALQSSSMSKISDMNSAPLAIIYVRNLLLKYILFSTFLAFMFFSAGQYIFNFFNILVFDFNYKNLLLLYLCCTAMYITNLIGIQFLSIYKYTLTFIGSVVFAAITFLILNQFYSDPIFLISLSELSVGIYQIASLYVILRRVRFKTI